MDVFKFIDSCCSLKQLPYVRLITLYLKNGKITNVCLCRFNDKKIIKKAKKVGLIEDRMLTDYGKGISIKNFNKVNLQNGSYYLNYNTIKKDLTVFKQ